MQISLDRNICSRFGYCQMFFCILICYQFLFRLFYFREVCFGAFRDCSTNSDPYLIFNSACSEMMLITYCSSFTSSVVAFSTGFLLKISVYFRLLPVMCCIAISKCTSRSNHLVSLALYCRLHQFLSINSSSVWWSVY